MLPVQPIAFFFEDQHRVEFVSPHLIEGHVDTQLQCGTQIQRTADKQSRLAGLRRVELVERAVVAAAAVLWRVGTQPWIAQLLAPQGPVDQEPKRGPLRPLPVQKFGSRSS